MTPGTSSPDKPGRLTKLRGWLTIPEAARHLALVFKEDVTEADVLRYGLDGHLTLSVRFVNFAKAVRYRDQTVAEMQELDRSFDLLFGKAPKDAGFPKPPPQETFRPPELVITLRDKVYDLPMIGGERFDVEHAYQRLTGGPEVTQIDPDGAFVDAADGTRFALRARLPKETSAADGPMKTDESWYPLGRLPDDSVLVVRTTALRELENRVLASPGLSSAGLTTKGEACSWQDVAICFTSDVQVQITVKKRLRPPQNFAELGGFEDQKTKAPTKAWLAFRRLAEARGEVKPEFEEKKDFEKRVQELRKLLRGYFRKEGFVVPEESDPLPCTRGTFRAAFTLGTSEAYGE